MTFSKRRIQLLLIDVAVLFMAYNLLWIMSSIGLDSIEVQGTFTFLKFFTLLICMMSFRLMFSIYSSIWRYANMMTYVRLVMADLLGGFVFLLLGRIWNSCNLGIAYGILLIMFELVGTLMTRLIYQLFYAYVSMRFDVKSGGKHHQINVAIVGAGNVGAALANEMLRNPKSHYHPYCFIDNDDNKVGNEVNGIKVYSGEEGVIELLNTMPVQEVVIAIPDAGPEERKRLYDIYKQTECKVKIYDYPLGTKEKSKSRRTLRELRVEDLLFRETLKVKSAKAEQFYKGKTVLVTGGGGSIGSELCRQIAALEPKKLIIFDIYENNAYEIQQELIRHYGDKLDLDVVIGSVRDVKRLEEIFSQHRPDIVFHAAAHKHVPLMEHSSAEAIKNNVMGTYNTANMAEKYGVKKFLLISTDKAVNPTNVMGASKRLCEMIIQCRHDSKTEFTAVRFGNVLGSNGSVIPLFRKQIENGGPVTLTDKRIIRYFMTIPEAVGLVMETGAMAHNGELFVLDMGKPVKILDLAENMIRLSGLKPYEDIDIVEIGLRPGEKLYEELLMKTEELDKTENDLIFIERDKGYTREEVEEKLTILLEAVKNQGYANVVNAIKQTVPTYHNPDEVNQQAAQSKEMNMVFNVGD